MDLETWSAGTSTDRTTWEPGFRSVSTFTAATKPYATSSPANRQRPVGPRHSMLDPSSAGRGRWRRRWRRRDGKGRLRHADRSGRRRGRPAPELLGGNNRVDDLLLRGWRILTR